MKGDYTRFTHDARKRYTRVLKQQGRVDLDADWNEYGDIIAHLERTEAIDVIGRCGVPEGSDGFLVEESGGGLTFTPGRIYVDGILGEQESDAPISLEDQPDLPGYQLPDEDGLYVVYADVWERHITALEDPEIREVALGGPDTATRLKTICQVKLAPVQDGGEVPPICQPFPGPRSTGRLTARAESAAEEDNPCVVPAAAGYRGLENRLYRVEIHDDGLDEDGNPVRTPTFKWSRDNGAVVLPVAENGIDGDEVTLQRLGPDEVLTVKVGHWVEVLGDETELHGHPGAMAQIEPDGVDEAQRKLTLSEDVSAHETEGHLKVRRWDHQDRADAPLVDGAVPVTNADYELEDGVIIAFEPGATYRVGDYWLIPARTREGTVLWPREGDPAVPVALPAHGIRHHYCTLAMVRRSSEWQEPHDCRPLFPPLTDLPSGGCCIDVEPGDDLRRAVSQAVRAGGGKICLCSGLHTVNGPLLLRNVENLTICGQNSSSVLQLVGTDEEGRGGIVVEASRRIGFADMVVIGFDTPSVVSVFSARATEQRDDAHTVLLRDLALLNADGQQAEGRWRAALELADTRDVLLENCRLMAEVGILTRFGESLPEPPEPPVVEGEAQDVTLDFSDRTVDESFNAGSGFNTGAAQVEVRPFTTNSGQILQGTALVEDGGGGDLRVLCRNVNLAFDFQRDFGEAAKDLTLEIVNQQLLFNIEINGELQIFNSYNQINDAIIGGVRVDVGDVQPGTSRRILSFEGDVETLAFGGMLVRIDQLRFLLGERPSLPDRIDLDYGRGVSDVRLHGCRVRYGRYGVFSPKSRRWSLDDCELSHDDLRLLQTLQPSNRTVLQEVLNKFASPANSTGLEEGTALVGFFWLDSRIIDCRLAGVRGVETWFSLGSEVSGCHVAARQFGLASLWLSRSSWTGNRVLCPDGPALAFVGTHRSSLQSNQTHSVRGCLKLPFADVAQALPETLAAIARAYPGSASGRPRRACWMLLEELSRLTGLDRLTRNIQDVLDRYYEAQAAGVKVLFQEPPQPVLYLLAGSLLDSLAEFQTQPDEVPFWISLGVLIPVMALRIDGNRMESEADTILIEQFLTLQGLRVEDNRLCSANGQTVRINAWPFAANPAFVAWAIRMLADVLAKRLTEFELADMGAAFENLRIAANRLVDTLAVGMTAAARRMRGCLGHDCRIAGNTLESLNTAIESNLFELAIVDNHISLSERRIENRFLFDVRDLLVANLDLRELGASVPSADVGAVEDAAREVGGREDAASLLFLDNNPALRRSSRATVDWSNFENRLNLRIADYDSAIVDRRFDDAVKVYTDIAFLLQDALNSYGIWAKGSGCRIDGNHILVPSDRDPETFAQGGIRLQGDEQVNQVILLMEALSQGLLDPLLDVTETLIDGNEVIGGVGHGIEILSIAGKSATGAAGSATRSGQPQALFGLKVRDNQIRSMGGAGLVIDQETLAIDVDIENNLITECGNREQGAQFTSSKGGVFIDRAALVRIRGNRIQRCGLVEGLEEGTAIDGLRLRQVLGLTLADNRIVGNGSRGATLEVARRVDICDNVFSYNDFTGLSVIRTEPDQVLLALLAFNFSPEIAEQDGEAPIQVVMADNVFRGHRTRQFELYLNEGRVTVQGNNCRGGAYANSVVATPGFLIVTGNLFDPDSSSNPPLFIHGIGAQLILTGNMSTKTEPIAISSIAPANIQKGFNQPPVP